MLVFVIVFVFVRVLVRVLVCVLVRACVCVCARTNGTHREEDRGGKTSACAHGTATNEMVSQKMA